MYIGPPDNLQPNYDYEITPYQWAGEFNQLDGIYPNTQFIFKSTNLSDVITIRRDTYDGPIVATGVTPLYFNSTFNGTIYVHWNTPNCGTDTKSRLTTFQIANDDRICNFVQNSQVTPSSLNRCFDLIPLNENVRSSTLLAFNEMLRLHPFTDLLLSKQGLDIRAELRKIQNAQYKRDFDFHFALHKLSLRISDDHTIYHLPPGYRNFLNLGTIFLPNGTTSSISIEPYDQYYGIIPEYQPVKKINGIPTVDYLSNQIPMNTRDKSVKFNNYIANVLYLPIFYRLSGNGQDVFADLENYEYDSGIKYNKRRLFLSLATVNSPSDIFDPLSLGYKKRGKHPVIEKSATKRKSLILETSLNGGISVTRELIPLEPKTIENLKQNYNASLDAPIIRNLNDRSNKKASSKEVNSSFPSQRVEIESVNGISYGLTDDKKVPFLKVSSFHPSDEISFKQTALNFVNFIASRRSNVAVIDVSSNSGGLADLTEWLVDLLSQTLPNVGDKFTYSSPSYHIYFDRRITSPPAKLLLLEFLEDFLDPTSGNAFRNSYYCLLDNPITNKRGSTVEEFTPLLFFNRSIDSVQPPPFHTFFHILSDGSCHSACSHFTAAMRQRNLAKVFVLGGITGQRLVEYSSTYGTNIVDWESLFPTFPLAGSLSFGTFEVFDISPPKVVDYDDHFNDGDYDHHHHHDEHHYDSYHYDKKEVKRDNQKNQNPSSRSFDPLQFSKSIRFADEVIPWSQNGDSYHLYDLISNKTSTISAQSFQTFCTVGNCYNYNIPCDN